MIAAIAPYCRPTVVALLVAFVGVSSYLYGSVETWSSEWLRVGALLAAALIVWTHPPSELLARPLGRLLLPLALFLVWGLVQTLPLPKAVLGVVSPKAAALYTETVPDGGAAGLPNWLLDKALSSGVTVGPDRAIPAAVPDEGDRAAGRAISLHPGDTRDALLAWVTPLVLLLCAAWAARSHRSRYYLVWGITAITGAWGLVALLMHLGWNGSPLWNPESAEGMVRPALPFINRNHYAGFVTMGSLVATGLVLAILTRTSGRLSGRAVREALLDRAWAAPRLLAAGVCAGAGIAGVILSGSRGGILALGGGLAFLVLVRLARSWLTIAAAAVVLVGALAGIPAMMQGDSVEFERAPFVSSQADPSGLMRMDAWAKTQRMFLDFPLTGTGLGTFRWGFSMYQRQGEYMIFREAHNDFLQAVAETGLIGAALLAWAFGVFLWFVLRPALRGDGGPPRFTTVGACAAVVALLVHSIVDFNLQIPSNAALFVVILGIVAAAAADAEPAAGNRAPSA